jgi:hypothetical protein
MGYVAQGAEGITVLKAAPITSPKCGPGKEWVPPAGGRAGYCRRLPSATGVRAGVRETPLSAEAQKCVGGKIGSKNYPPYRGEDLANCKSWVASGQPYAKFAIANACHKRGYTGQSFDLCVDGRSQGISYDEIDATIAALAEQASAVEQAQLQQEQAAVAARKRRTLLIFGGLAAAGVAGFLIWKKRKGK